MTSERRIALGDIGEEERQGPRQGRGRRKRPEDSGGLEKGIEGLGHGMV